MLARQTRICPIWLRLWPLPKCSVVWSENVSDLSHLGSIWTTFWPVLTWLCKTDTRVTWVPDLSEVTSLFVDVDAWETPLDACADTWCFTDTYVINCLGNLPLCLPNESQKHPPTWPVFSDSSIFFYLMPILMKSSAKNKIFVGFFFRNSEKISVSNTSVKNNIYFYFIPDYE